MVFIIGRSEKKCIYFIDLTIVSSNPQIIFLRSSLSLIFVTVTTQDLQENILNIV